MSITALTLTLTLILLTLLILTLPLHKSAKCTRLHFLLDGLYQLRPAMLRDQCWLKTKKEL